MATKSKSVPSVAFTFEIEPDTTPIEGNVLASGDASEDRAQEAWVREQLEAGNVAAWAVATVKATVGFEGETFEGFASVGGCSYDSEEILRRDVEADLRDEALGALRRELARDVKRGTVAAKLAKLDARAWTKLARDAK